MIALLLALLVQPALACKFMTGLPHEVVDNPDDILAPIAPTEEDVSTTRGHGPVCSGFRCASTSCDGFGRIAARVGAATDDVSPPEAIGYRLRVVEGAPPDGLTVDETRRADEIVDGVAGLLLVWIDEATDEQEAFDFVLGITPVDEAGNEGEELLVAVSDPGREAGGGCATVPDAGPGALGLGLLVAAARRRRSPHR